MPDETNASNGSYNPLSKCIPIAVTTPMLGVNRKVEVENTSAVDDVENASLLRVSKVLIECPEYDAIKSYVGKLKSTLRRMCPAGSSRLFRAGTYPIPKARVLEVLNMLGKAKGELLLLVAKFAEAYEQRKAENIKGLGSLANVDDYPPVEEVKQHFDIDYEFVNYGIPEDMRSMDADVFGAEFDRLRDKVRRTGDEVMQAMTIEMQKAIDAFYEALSPSTDGKRKVIAKPLKTLSELLKDFASLFEGSQLEVVSKKLQAILASTNPETLRESASTRKLVTKQLADIKAVVAQNVTAAPVRKFRVGSRDDSSNKEPVKE